MKFLKKENLDLVNGGYLVEKGTNTPVYNADFVKLQTEALYLIRLSERVKTANFENKKLDNFNDLKNEVTKSIIEEKIVQYVNVNNEPKLKIRDELAKEALTWLNYQKLKNNADSVNDKMQNFNLLLEFEKFGLYFSEDKIVKLTQIFTIEEIKNAIIILEPHLL